MAVAFGETQGIELLECLRFVGYSERNYFGYVDRVQDTTKLFDKDGKIITNWKGALINFAKTPYNQEEWVKNNKGEAAPNPHYFERIAKRKDETLFNEYKASLGSD